MAAERPTRGYGGIPCPFPISGKNSKKRTIWRNILPEKMREKRTPPGNPVQQNYYPTPRAQHRGTAAGPRPSPHSHDTHIRVLLGLLAAKRVHRAGRRHRLLDAFHEVARVCLTLMTWPNLQTYTQRTAPDCTRGGRILSNPLRPEHSRIVNCPNLAY